MAFPLVSSPKIVANLSAQSHKDIFDVAYIDIPHQVKPSNLRKAVYVVSSILSVGLVPLIGFGLSKLVRSLVLPAVSMSSPEIKTYNLELKEIFTVFNPTKFLEFDLKIADGAIVNGMAIFQNNSSKKSFEGKKAEEQKWIIRFNGNGEFYEPILSESQRYAEDVGANMLVFNYRGVGESKGSLTKPEELILDGEACVRYLLSKGVKEENILIHGLSLGGGIGTQVASLHDKIAIINERSFSSLSKEAAAISGIPIAEKLLLTLGWELDSVAAFEKIKAKKLIVFHKKDAVIPYHQSSLYKVLKERIKKQNPSVVDVKNHKRGVKERLKAEKKPLKIKLQAKFRGVNINAHNYTLRTDPAYPALIRFSKDFFGLT